MLITGRVELAFDCVFERMKKDRAGNVRSCQYAEWESDRCSKFPFQGICMQGKVPSLQWPMIDITRRYASEGVGSFPKAKVSEFLGQPQYLPSAAPNRLDGS